MRHGRSARPRHSRRGVPLADRPDVAGRTAIAYDCLFPYASGGGERVYRRIAELLVERGHEVDYVTRTQWERGAEPRLPFRVVPVWTGDIHDAEGTRTSGSAVAFAFSLFRHFVRHRHDHDAVLVGALPVLNVFAVHLALVGSHTAVVSDWLEIWGYRTWRRYSGALTGTIAWVLQWVALRLGRVMTVNSRFTAERMRRFRRGAEPLVLGLVDLVGASADASPGRVPPPLALFVGRHIPDKRLDALPRAILEARRRHPELHAVVAGTGPETERVERMVDDLHLRDAIRFAGRVDDDELERLFASAHVLVHPSRREGFGLVVAEAAAHGTPSVVVAGPDNAAVELVGDGVNGFTAPSAAPVDLGGAIAAALDGGEALRTTTLEWFRRERVERSLARSVDELLLRVAALRSRRRA